MNPIDGVEFGAYYDQGGCIYGINSINQLSGNGLKYAKVYVYDKQGRFTYEMHRFLKDIKIDKRVKPRGVE